MSKLLYHIITVRSMGSVALRMGHHLSLTTQFDFYSIDFNEVNILDSFFTRTVIANLLINKDSRAFTI